LQIEQELTKL